MKDLYTVTVYSGFSHWYKPIEELTESFNSLEAANDYVNMISKYRPNYCIIIEKEKKDERDFDNDLIREVWQYDEDNGCVMCRCPNCNGRLLIAVYQYYNPYKFCPYCGKRTG